MNKRPLTTEQAAALKKVCHLFADWRKARIARERIPDHRKNL